MSEFFETGKLYVYNPSLEAQYGVTRKGVILEATGSRRLMPVEILPSFYTLVMEEYDTAGGPVMRGYDDIRARRVNSTNKSLLRKVSFTVDPELFVPYVEGMFDKDVDLVPKAL